MDPLNHSQMLTNKRLQMIGGGTTQPRLDEVTYMECDFDNEPLVLHKRGVGRPTWIKTDEDTSLFDHTGVTATLFERSH